MRGLLVNRGCYYYISRGFFTYFIKSNLNNKVNPRFANTDYFNQITG